MIIYLWLLTATLGAICLVRLPYLFQNNKSNLHIGLLVIAAVFFGTHIHEEYFFYGMEYEDAYEYASSAILISSGFESSKHLNPICILSDQGKCLAYETLAHLRGYHSQSVLCNAALSDVDDSEFYTDRFVSINVNLSLTVAGKLNQRQLWFLGKLQQGIKLKAGDIAETWEISTRTAWRDITILVDMGLICFIGSRKKGWYAVSNCL